MKKTTLFFGCSISLFALMMLVVFTGCEKKEPPNISGLTLSLPSLLIDVNRQSKDSIVAQFTTRLRSNLMSGMDTKQIIAEIGDFDKSFGEVTDSEEDLNKDNLAISFSDDDCYSADCLFPMHYVQRVGDPCKGGKCYDFSLIRRLACRFDTQVNVTIRDIQGNNVPLSSSRGAEEVLSNEKVRYFDLPTLKPGEDYLLEVVYGSTKYNMNIRNLIKN